MFSWILSLFGGEKKETPSFVTEEEFMEFLDLVRQGFSSHRDRIASLEEAIELLKKEKEAQSVEVIADLGDKVGALYSRMDEIEDAFEDLSTRFSGLSEEFSRIRDRISGLEARLSDFDEKLLDLKREISKRDVHKSGEKKAPNMDIGSLELPAKENLTPLEMEIIRALISFNVNENKKSVTLKELAQKIHDTTDVSAKIPTLSVYVTKLVYRGLLTKERVGQNVYISINKENVANLLARLGYEQLARAL